MEIWKDVIGYEGLYMVSNTGNVKSLNYNHTKSAKLLSPKYHRSSNYMTVTLCDNTGHKNKAIHRLVAEAFVPNPLNLPFVNHIDGDKENNSSWNLEWVTAKENTTHAIKTGLRKDSNMRGVTGSANKNSKPVFQYEKRGKLVKKWDCISDAAREFGCAPSTIINCCAKRIKSCKGYIWEYAEI